MAAELPPGLMPLFFTGATQELFGCVVDKDVTPENPQKLIPLERIHQDFRDRAAVSDFHPCKQEMQVWLAWFLPFISTLSLPCPYTIIVFFLFLFNQKIKKAYTGTEVLVVFDPDFKYGQNFFVCLTEEAKNNYIQVSFLNENTRQANQIKR